MNWTLLAVQVLNSVQLGALLFLLAAGLTLVFGIMNFMNLAHGSLYMVGAYVGAMVVARSGSFLLAATAAAGMSMLVGVLVERTLLRKLYERSHLDQVLCTFGLILIFNEVIRYIWGVSPIFLNVPQALNGTVNVAGQNYPSYRLAIILAGVTLAIALYFLINKTRVGKIGRAHV